MKSHSATAKSDVLYSHTAMFQLGLAGHETIFHAKQPFSEHATPSSGKGSSGFKEDVNVEWGIFLVLFVLRS